MIPQFNPIEIHHHYSLLIFNSEILIKRVIHAIIKFGLAFLFMGIPS